MYDDITTMEELKSKIADILKVHNKKSCYGGVSISPITRLYGHIDEKGLDPKTTIMYILKRCSPDTASDEEHIMIEHLGVLLEEWKSRRRWSHSRIF